MTGTGCETDDAIVEVSGRSSLESVRLAEEGDTTAVPIEGQPWSRWNFSVLALDHVVLRIGWIFKTESIIIPAVLDAIGGSGWLRGCLPLLNRFGQSVPPLLAAPTVARATRKRTLLILCGAVMAACFGLLSIGWSSREQLGPVAAPAVFLAVYAIFFATTGVHQLVFNTLQGKLVPVTWRGKLLLASNIVGAPAAIAFAAWLLPKWLEHDRGNFTAIFGFSAVAFAVAAASGWLLVERRDARREKSADERAVFRAAWRAMRHDRHLRQLACVAACFGSCIVLFPHYQSLGRSERIGFDMRSLMTWVVLQNLGTAVFSIVLGPVADRWGNRRVLLIGLLGIAAAPSMAVASIYAGDLRRWLFPATFVVIGLTPVMFRVVFNFSLELASPVDHPRYLSVLGVATSLPALAAPLVGRAIDVWGYEVVFLSVSTVLAAGWFLAFRMPEPRHDSSVVTS